MKGTAGFVATLVCAVVAAALAGWFGAVKFLEHRPHASLHKLLHDELALTADQEGRLEKLEGDYESLRKRREAELRLSNAELAAAIRTTHAYGPDVQASVDRFHNTMREFQKETIIHVLAMREVLTPDQAAKFDDRVTSALTASHP